MPPGCLKWLGWQIVPGKKARNLPDGHQRRLEIVRALALKPKLLLLDEPAAGMNPDETCNLMDFIHEIKENFNLTILLIEHHMEVVMGLCDQIVVIDFGKTIARGTPEEIQGNQTVIDAYSGNGGVRMDTSLQIKDLYVSYGGVRALQGISLHVDAVKLLS